MFNAAVLIALALALLTLAVRFGPGRIERGSTQARAAGVLLLAFGAGYPHFLETDSVLTYAYAAPMGVIPCSTLAIVVGITLCANGLGSRAWCLTLAAFALFYGLVGAALLGVLPDVALVAGAIVLARVGFEVPRAVPVLNS